MTTALRSTTRISVIAILAVLASLLISVPSASARQAPSAEEQMAQLINAERVSNGLSALPTNTLLLGIARDWSVRMAAAGGISHRSMTELASLAPADWQRLGENVGRSQRPGSTDAELIERLHVAFMNSPGHRDNVLGNWNQMGVGVEVAADGTLYITINFMLATSVPAPAPAPAPAPVPAPEPAPAYTGDIEGPVQEAAAIARQVFANRGAGGRQAEYAVVARAEVFADALGGAGLAADKAPILFTGGPNGADTNPSLHPTTAAEIRRILGGSGTVYLLGGTEAISERVVSELAGAGYHVVRLAGASRVETSVRVAQEIIARHGAPREVIIARADDWPDAVSGGAFAAATRSPVVLTGRDSLHPAVGDLLATTGSARRWALGGTAALSDAVVAASAARRVAGPDRTATAVAVAQEMWGRTAAASGDGYTSAPGYGNEAWAYALALAPWSAVHASPQLLVSSDVPPSVNDYLGQLGYGNGVQGHVQAASAVPQPVTETLRRLVQEG
jgi:uncharacterized protein YkwD